ncbi:efflux pump antibiotic resistance protein, putative [Talaromyces stipitatus ATCC 10500]|uniref:Efflux pump antibiotic resistance protein, putative n=1 Tax=Talaromyces stipitatus (strain ATCC 10500 / CBS 375.48 / QM 6759 / NRRL 1006) TaxID=441959 RepID=B8MPH8_TALSN|nr:efflux pump antibiotic resistance protein, putative [Talaromyces stipitatus ATCC 10500]EED14417.1 efflux pump antibiotic resistance protein, putative [Talaromyces stipitatus ATCC 10500]
MELEGGQVPAGKPHIPIEEPRNEINLQEELPTMSLSGWRLHLLTAGMWLALFLSTVETTIVGTSLVSITNALGGFDKRDWVVTSYLLTYTGFLTIYAKLGDILGRKTMFIVGLWSFSIFSILCGVSSNIVELDSTYDHSSRENAQIHCTDGYGICIGKCGGTFDGRRNYRKWALEMDIPVQDSCQCYHIFTLPSSSNKASQPSDGEVGRRRLSSQNLRRIDNIGVVLLLAASILLVFAFENAGIQHAWGSPTIIVTLVLGFAIFFGFITWEVWLQRRQDQITEPIFPPRILESRIMASMFAASFFLGFPFNSVIVNIPQRAQAVYAFSSRRAGITLLPLLLTSPLATVTSGILTSNGRVPPVYVITVGEVIQLVGMGLMCSLPTNTLIFPPQQYAFEVIMGIGLGLTLSTILTLAPVVANKKDLPVTMGALTQIRVLGGTFGLAISATVLNDHVKSKLSTLLSPPELEAILDSLDAIKNLSQNQQQAVKAAFSEGFNRQNVILAAFSAVALVLSLGIWERHPRKTEKSNP